MIIVCINRAIGSHRVGLRNYFDVGDEVHQFIFDLRADRLEIDLSSTVVAHVPLRDKGGVIYRRLYEQIFKQRARTKRFSSALDRRNREFRRVSNRFVPTTRHIDRLNLTLRRAIILPSTCSPDAIGLFPRARLLAAPEMFIAGQ